MSCFCSCFKRGIQIQPYEEPSSNDVKIPGNEGSTQAVTSGQLIVSQGDISDVDGFFALAEYAKTGADVFYVMNYPAYLGVKPEESVPDADYEKAHPGLGYKYSAMEVLAQVTDPPIEFSQFMGRYDQLKSDNERVKYAMTDMAHYLASKIWDESIPTEIQGRPGRLFFGIGGINAINPFSAKAIKFEVLFYCQNVHPSCVRLSPANEGDTYDAQGNPCGIDFLKYSEIYLDFNGSMAAFSEDSLLKRQLAAAGERLKGAVVMGGVQADEPAKTMPAIEGVLNRFSAATMNQLYHPPNAARFFRFLADRRGVPCLTVTNNAVADLATFSDPARTVKTYDGVERFLRGNGIGSRTLREISRLFYESKRLNPPRKAFDYHAAIAVARLARAGGAPPPEAARRTLFYSGELGLALVAAEGADWRAARERYAAGLDTRPAEGDGDFVRRKKLGFAAEVAAMAELRLEVGGGGALSLAVSRG